MSWLSGVPVGALYGLIFLASLVEGVLPVMPGDVAAALLAFLAARAGGQLVPTIIMVTAGSIAGSLVMWWLGRRFGADWMTHQLGRFGLLRAESQLEKAEHKIEDAYQQYGWVALFVSRFVPGLRAVVPAAAGALRVPFWEVTLIFTVASGIWYGTIAWLAFRVGEDWASVRESIEVVARDVGLGAAAVAAVLGLVGWRLWKKRRATVAAEKAAAAARGEQPVRPNRKTPTR